MALECKFNCTDSTKLINLAEDNGEKISPESFLAAMCIMGFIIFIGSFGNGLVLYVYAHKNDKLTSTLFILALSIVDFITCILIIPMTIAMEMIEFHTDSFVFCKLYYILNTSGIPFSSLLMSAIALDRYFCICHPFLRIMTLKRAKILIFILAVLSLFMGVLVAFLCIRIAPLDDFQQMVLNTSSLNSTAQQGGFSTPYMVDQSNENLSRLVASAHRQHICIETHTYTEKGGHTPSWERVFYTVIQKVHITCFILCIVLVIVLYVLIYRSVLEMRKKREKMKGRKVKLSDMQCKVECAELATSPDKLICTNNCLGSPKTIVTCESDLCDEVNVNDAAKQTLCAKKSNKSLKSRDKQSLQNLKTAAMLFVVALVFILTFVPAGLMANSFLKFNIVVFYMYYTNNAANPVIYCFMNKNFRDDLNQIFGGAGREVGSSRRHRANTR